MFDYHPFLTDLPGDTLAVEADHRRHALVELAIRDLKAGGLAHVPSGKFAANAAWLALACLAHNLARWSLRAAGADRSRATTDTFRRRIVAMPARVVHSACTLKCLRAPTNWPWRDAYHAALTAIRAIPLPTWRRPAPSPFATTPTTTPPGTPPPRPRQPATIRPPGPPGASHRPP